MTDELRQFLSALTPVAEDEVAWLGQTIRLRLAVYLSDTLPPLKFVTSVRAVVLTEAGCAILKNTDGVHALPGGRCEAGEEIAHTLRREIAEETGCEVNSAALLGWLHFHHLTPKPPDYAYPYPDFVQAVFAVRATASPFTGDPDGYETSVEFVAFSELGAVAIPPYQRMLVDAARERLR